MSLQIECSIEKSVTNRAAQRLENCINVVHVAYVVVVYKQSNSIFAFLHTSSSKFTDNVPTKSILYSRMLTVSRSSTKESGSYEFHGIDRCSIHPFYSWIIWKILKFLLPVVECHAYGEQAHERGTTYRHTVVLYFFQTWDSWLRDF